MSLYLDYQTVDWKVHKSKCRSIPIPVADSGEQKFSQVGYYDAYAHAIPVEDSVAVSGGDNGDGDNNGDGDRVDITCSAYGACGVNLKKCGQCTIKYYC